MIILSLPFLNSQFLLRQVENLPVRYKWLEFRLDFHPEPVSFPCEILTDNSILTIRDQSEGGKFPFDYSCKIDLYNKALLKFKGYVDCEANLFHQDDIDPEHLIISRHFSTFPAAEELDNLLDLAEKFGPAYLKVACPLDSYHHLSQIGQFIRNSDKNIIFAGYGFLGKLSRLLYSVLGARGTFFSLDGLATYPGQISASEAELFNIHSITTSTRLGGILGGDQVYNSLGLTHYNELFKTQNCDAVYLPFPAVSFTDFRGWFREYEHLFYAISITMPFKQQACYLAETSLQAANLYVPATRKLLNTDAAAFQMSLNFLQFKPGETILILGTGATAATLLSLLPATTRIFVTGRNETRGRVIAPQYNSTFISIKQAASLQYDLLVNCTPLGLDRENPAEVFKLQLPGKVIDLVYGPRETSLIRLCRQRKIKYVDGKTFWDWQAVIQEKIMLEELRSCL
ncbi:MAG: type I 3-dehydroquinate dehydratase [Candidatus Cloacimonetes bacterium]|nr:type I 3-dehydroquinate dehydratase [Candidatus Cloacimonadota bacterium]